MTRAWYWNTVRWSNRLFGPNLSQRVPLIGRLLHTYIWISERLGPARRKQVQFEHEHPDAPWWAPDSIPYIEALLKPDMRVFEWGSGRSTVWLAQRVRHITSIETIAEWWGALSENLRWTVGGTRASVRLVAPDSHAYLAPIHAFARASLDLIVVDGLHRVRCLEEGWPKLKPGRYLILDNAERPDLAAWRSQHQTELMRVFTSKLQDTAIYQKAHL